MDRIRRTSFVQEGATITIGDYEVAACDAANLSAPLAFLKERTQRISCVRHSIQMPNGNAMVPGSQRSQCCGRSVSLHKHQVRLFRLKHRLQTIHQTAAKGIQTLPKSCRFKMMLNAYSEQLKERLQQAGVPTQIDHDKINSSLLQHFDHRCKLDQFRTGAKTDQNLERIRVNYFDHIYKYHGKHSLIADK